MKKNRTQHKRNKIITTIIKSNNQIKDIFQNTDMIDILHQFLIHSTAYQNDTNK